MTTFASTFRRISVVLGLVAAMLVPAVSVSPTAGLVATILTVAIVAVAVSLSASAPTSRLPAMARHALGRMMPRTPQFDPDARGHARPRAPGRLSTAV